MMYIYSAGIKTGKKLLLTNQLQLDKLVCFLCLNSNKLIHLQKLEVFAAISHRKTNWDK